MPILTWLGFPGEPDKWRELGFDVTDDRFDVGLVECATATEPAWGFDELRGETAMLGVPTKQHDPIAVAGTHPNGIDRIDHVVYTVANLDDAVDTLTLVLGAPPRRRFHPRGPDGPEMAFFRVGEGFIEVVSANIPPRFGGIAFNSPDLDATVAAIRDAGGPVGDPKPAVQGGRIASVWRDFVGYPVAIMEPRRA